MVGFRKDIIFLCLFVTFFMFSLYSYLLAECAISTATSEVSALYQELLYSEYNSTGREYRYNEALKNMTMALYVTDNGIGGTAMDIPIEDTDLFNEIIESTNFENIEENVYSFLNQRDSFFEYKPVIYPVPKSLDAEITSLSGFRRHPFSTKYIQFHNGVDITSYWHSPVISTAKGIVIEIGYNKILGNFVIINHGDEFETLYGHLDKVNIALNQEVDKAQVIGVMGGTGKVTGDHVHYEIRRNGVYIKPENGFLEKYISHSDIIRR